MLNNINAIKKCPGFVTEKFRFSIVTFIACVSLSKLIEMF